MIYVTHRLDEVFRVSDRVAVMRNGRLVGIGPTADMTESQVVEMIVGRELEKLHQIEKKKDREEAGPELAITLENVVIGDVGPVDLSINAGEIVGLTGLRGAGQELWAGRWRGSRPSTPATFASVAWTTPRAAQPTP